MKTQKNINKESIRSEYSQRKYDFKISQIDNVGRARDEVKYAKSEKEWYFLNYVSSAMGIVGGIAIIATAPEGTGLILKGIASSFSFSGLYFLDKYYEAAQERNRRISFSERHLKTLEGRINK